MIKVESYSSNKLSSWLQDVLSYVYKTQKEIKIDLEFQRFKETNWLKLIQFVCLCQMDNTFGMWKFYWIKFDNKFLLPYINKFYNPKSFPFISKNNHPEEYYFLTFKTQKQVIDFFIKCFWKIINEKNTSLTLEDDFSSLGIVDWYDFEEELKNPYSDQSLRIILSEIKDKESEDKDIQRLDEWTLFEKTDFWRILKCVIKFATDNTQNRFVFYNESTNELVKSKELNKSLLFYEICYLKGDIYGFDLNWNWKNIIHKYDFINKIFDYFPYTTESNLSWWNLMAISQKSLLFNDLKEKINKIYKFNSLYNFYKQWINWKFEEKLLNFANIKIVWIYENWIIKATRNKDVLKLFENTFPEKSYFYGDDLIEFYKWKNIIIEHFVSNKIVNIDIEYIDLSVLSI